MILSFMLFVLILLVSTSLLRIVSSLLTRVTFPNFLVLVPMFIMVLPNASIVTFLRLLVLYYSPLSFHLTFGRRLSLRLFFSLIDSLPQFFRAVPRMNACLAIHPTTVIFVALGVPALFFSLLVSAPS
jgi:hypothetical protein